MSTARQAPTPLTGLTTMSHARLRVAIAESHGAVRRRLQTTIAQTSDMEFVGDAHGAFDAVGLLDELRAKGRPAHVLLLDAPADLENARAVTTLIAQRHPDVRVVTTMWSDDPDPALGALDGGAVGCLLKDAAIEELTWAIRAAAHGDVVLGAQLARRLAVVARRPHSDDALFDQLTTREREILGFVARGLPNKLIALELAISERTARTHVSNVLRKLGVTSRTQAALLAVQAGLVDTEA